MKTQTKPIDTTPTLPSESRDAAPCRAFEERLADIRVRGDQRAARRRTTDREALVGAARRLLDTFDFVDRARDIIAGPIGELRRELADGMTLDQGVFDGRWLVAARLQEPRVDALGRPEGAWSRVAFQIDTDRADGCAGITCRVTVRGRDQATTGLEISADADGLVQLAGYVEERLLAFARAYFAAAPVLRCAD